MSRYSWRCLRCSCERKKEGEAHHLSLLFLCEVRPSGPKCQRQVDRVVMNPARMEAECSDSKRKDSCCRERLTGRQCTIDRVSGLGVIFPAKSNLKLSPPWNLLRKFRATAAKKRRSAGSCPIDSSLQKIIEDEMKQKPCYTFLSSDHLLAWIFLSERRN